MRPPERIHSLQIVKLVWLWMGTTLEYKQFLEDEGIHTINCPQQLPDLRPI